MGLSKGFRSGRSPCRGPTSWLYISQFFTLLAHGHLRLILVLVTHVSFALLVVFLYFPSHICSTNAGSASPHPFSPSSHFELWLRGIGRLESITLAYPNTHSPLFLHLSPRSFRSKAFCPTSAFLYPLLPRPLRSVLFSRLDEHHIQNSK